MYQNIEVTAVQEIISFRLILVNLSTSSVDIMLLIIALRTIYPRLNNIIPDEAHPIGFQVDLLKSIDASSLFISFIRRQRKQVVTT